MPITKVAGFAHLASDGRNGDYSKGHSFVQSEYTVVQARVGSMTPLGYAPSNGRMAYGKQLYNGSGSAHGISTLELAPFFGGLDPATFKKFILTFQLETTGTALSANFPMVGFTLNDVAAASGTGYATDDLICYNTASGWTAKIMLVEASFDLVNKKLEYYVDGVLNQTLTIPDRFITGFAGIKLFSGRKDTTVCGATSNGTTNYFGYFGNMYAVADTGDSADPYRGRLGLMLVERIPVTAVDGDWSPSTGTNLSVINTARSDEASTNQTPVSVSPGNNSGLTLSFDFSAYSSKRPLLGMSTSVGSWKASSETGALDAQWTSSEGDQTKVEVPSPNLASTSVVARLQGVKAIQALPANANLSSLKLKLLPR